MSEDFNPLFRPSKDTVQALEGLVESLGLELLNIVLGTKRGQVSRWIKGDANPTEQQRKLIMSLYDVVSILDAYLPPEDYKLWLISHSEFIFGIPVKEIRVRPEDVRQAALNRVARGEDYEIFQRMNV